MAGRSEGDPPCGVFTVADIRTVVADVVRFVAVDGRCRFVRASGSDAAVTTIDAYPNDESAAAGLRQARLALAVDRCRSAGAGDESYVCVPTSGPVGTVGFVRRARSVLRLDVVAPADAARVAELLRIAAPRL